MSATGSMSILCRISKTVDSPRHDSKVTCELRADTPNIGNRHQNIC